MRDEWERLKDATPARLDIGRAGSRYTTEKFLQFRAAHAVAVDAVNGEVSPETVANLGLPEVHTRCTDKYDFLTRPDRGRVFDDEQKAILKAHCIPSPDVQIYCGDGLSAPAMQNVADLLPMLTLALNQQGLTVGTPFFVRYCRVNTAREIGPLLDAKVVCVLIGERPGLTTDESMSAYIAYRPTPAMTESGYTVISNIHRRGMPPVEAAAYAAELIGKMIEQQASGVKLKL